MSEVPATAAALAIAAKTLRGPASDLPQARSAADLLEQLASQLRAEGASALERLGRPMTDAEVGVIARRLARAEEALAGSGALDAQRLGRAAHLEGLGEALRALPGMADRSDDVTRPGAISLGRERSALDAATDQARREAGEPGRDYRDALAGLGPALASNASKSPPLVVGQPSSDARDWAGGSRGQEGGPWTHVDLGGGIGVFVPAEKPTDKVTGVVHNQLGPSTTVTVTNRSDGSYTVQVYSDHPDGSGSVSYRHYDADGQQEGETVLIEFPPRDDIDRTQDPDAASHAGGAAAHYDHSAKQGAPEVVKVNPGPDGAQSQPQAARLVMARDDVVINPSPDAAQPVPGGRMDAEAARRSLERAKPEHVLPPRPGDGPDDGPQPPAG